MLNRKFRIIALVLSVLAAVPLVSGCALFPAEEEELPPPLVEAVVANYHTYNPERGTIENVVSGKANVSAVSSVNVAFQASGGLFMEAYFRQGDFVQAGDVLAETDNSDLAETLKVAEMQAEIDELVYAEAKARYEAGNLSEVDWKRAEKAIYLARRDINALREQFSTTQLIAPVSGRVTYVMSMTKGSPVSAGVTMFTISDDSELIIRYSEKGFSEIPMDAEVDLSYEMKDGTVQTFSATVVQTPDIVPEDSSDKHVVICKSDSIPKDIPIGARLDLTYVVERSEDTIFIRSSSIKTVGDRKYVYILKDGYRQERDIITGIESEYETEILDGLSETDLVIQ
ncbi:MAG: efflux RND transporter periplasmic adaptor subunit [Clostridia bacterium]|nr:efflux RND transporter periplasmic adaptor subunit [Clostridia bacterium]